MTVSHRLTIYQTPNPQICVKSPSSSISLNTFPGAAIEINFEVFWALKTR